MRGLVVDDSSVMRKVMAGALTRAGVAEVEQAADGLQAVEACRKGKFDIVLMDWNMPNMLGIDALKSIRTQDKATPIIMVTTEAEKSRVIDALKAGANNYVIKPFETTAIVSKIQETLAKAA